MSNKAHDRKDRREILLLVVIRVMFPSLITSQFMHTDHKLYSLLPDGGAADWASSAAPGGQVPSQIGVCDRQNAGFCCQVYLEVWWPSAGGQSWMNYWMTCPNSPRWMTDPLCPCNPNPQSCPADEKSCWKSLGETTLKLQDISVWLPTIYDLCDVIRFH